MSWRVRHDLSHLESAFTPWAPQELGFQWTYFQQVRTMIPLIVLVTFRMCGASLSLNCASLSLVKIVATPQYLQLSGRLKRGRVKRRYAMSFLNGRPCSGHANSHMTMTAHFGPASRRCSLGLSPGYMELQGCPLRLVHSLQLLSRPRCIHNGVCSLADWPVPCPQV